VIDFPGLLRALVDRRVQFVIVGGAAATAHGAARLTQDLDVVYEQLVSDRIEIELFGVRCLCLGLEKLIQVKRAAGRPKDFEVLAELESIRDRDE
jgi:predicted nucleotidyltransferase